MPRYSRLNAQVWQRGAFSATCPGKPEANPIADGYEKRMAEKKAVPRRLL